MLYLHLGLLLLLQLLVSSCFRLLEVPCVQDQASSCSICCKACVACCPCWLVLRYHEKLNVEPSVELAHLFCCMLDTAQGPWRWATSWWSMDVLILNTNNQPTNQPTTTTTTTKHLNHTTTQQALAIPHQQGSLIYQYIIELLTERWASEECWDSWWSCKTTRSWIW